MHLITLVDILYNTLNTRTAQEHIHNSNVVVTSSNGFMQVPDGDMIKRPKLLRIVKGDARRYIF